MVLFMLFMLTMSYEVIGTGLIGWLLNIVLVLCSGPLSVLLSFHSIGGHSSRL